MLVAMTPILHSADLSAASHSPLTAMVAVLCAALLNFLN